MNRKGIAVLSLIVCIVGLYFSGSMINMYFFKNEGSGMTKSIFDELITPVYVWIASLLIGAYGIYELRRN